MNTVAAISPETRRRKLLKAHEVAKRLDVNEHRVREMARLGILPCVRLGRQVRFDAEKLEAWIEAGGQALPGGWRQEVAA